MLPLILGLLIAGPTSGYLSDRFGARPFATGGMLVAATSFALLIALPVNFGYPEFALILLLNGIGMGLFQSPNTAAVMNSLPPSQRGAGAGMLATFNVSSSVLSIGVFFTLMIVGLAVDCRTPRSRVSSPTASPRPTRHASHSCRRSPRSSRRSSATTPCRRCSGRMSSTGSRRRTRTR